MPQVTVPSPCLLFVSIPYVGGVCRLVSAASIAGFLGACSNAAVVLALALQAVAQCLRWEGCVVTPHFVIELGAQQSPAQVLWLRSTHA